MPEIEWKESPVFGRFREPTEGEEELLQAFADHCPVRLFQIVNKLLNAKGMCCHIVELPHSGGE
jgi:hypothetical protein